MKSIILFTTLALSALSCVKKQQPVIQVSTKTIKIPFTIAQGYFAKDNVLNPVLKPKITSKEEFDKYFASTATKNTLATKIDFSKDFVIAVVSDKSNHRVELTPESLTAINGGLFFNYIRKKGAVQSFVLQPVLIVIVSKKYSGNVIVNRIDEN